MEVDMGLVEEAVVVLEVAVMAVDPAVDMPV